MQELTKRFLIIFFFESFTSGFVKPQRIETVPLWKLISSTIQTDTRNTQLNIGTLEGLLRGIDYLNLHLFNESNLENDIIQQLLQQSLCPLQLSVGRMMPQPSSNQRHWALVTSSADLAMNLNSLARQQWIERGALRIFYILPNESSGSFDCYFLNPFVKTGEQRGEMSRLDGQSYQRIFQNLHGYPLRTYIFHSVYSNIEAFANETTRKIIGATGADGKVADLLAKKMNFTMDLQWPDNAFFGARLSNGSYNGAIGRIVRFETDLIITGFFIKDYLTPDIAFSSPVYMDELCCYVKKASRIPQSILPLFAVNVDIWIAFIFVGFVCPFIWMLLRYLNLSTLANRAAVSQLEKLKTPERRYTTQSHVQQYKRIFIDAWVMWVRVNIVYYPPFISERVFIASLCLVSVIFGALFESSLATGYIRPLHFKDINSMKELDDANIRIYIKHAAMRDDLFYGHSSKIYQNLEKKLLLIAELEERLIRTMSRVGRFASVTRASSLELDDIHYFITNKIHKIPECPKNYHIAFVFPSQSPLEKNINILLLKFVQAGFIDHWIGDMKYKAKIRTRNFSGYLEESGEKWKILTLSDLQLAFYTIIFGSILAFVVLVIEWIMQCRRKSFF